MEQQLSFFYNTTNATDPWLTRKRIKCNSQAEVILNYFRSHEGAYTPFEIQERCGLSKTPITSIRRAITDLTHAGYLEKTSEKKDGLYGDKNYMWRLAQI